MPDHVHRRLRAVARDLVHDDRVRRLGPMRPLRRGALNERVERKRLGRLHEGRQEIHALPFGRSPRCVVEPPVHILRRRISVGQRRQKRTAEIHRSRSAERILALEQYSTGTDPNT